MHINKISAFLIFAPVLISCSTGLSYDKEKKNRISVSLVDDSRYAIVDHNQETSPTNKNVAYLNKGHSINYTIKVSNDYYLTGTDYINTEIAFIGEGKYHLSLSDINYSLRVTLLLEKIDDKDTPEEQKNVITYDANGGDYYYSHGYKMNKVVYSTTHHPRVNTSIGTNIMKRDGYVLFGWNTKADGTGVHIGLGSRYLDENNDSFTLYASWAKYSDSSLFSISSNEGKAIINKYLGNESTVVIPEVIGSDVITSISSNAFSNVKCQNVILPKTIESISENAFVNCSFSDFYFYDNLIDINDSCFMDCNEFKTVHINAIEAPRYASSDRHSTYADKIDYLILSRNKKKIVIMGGSGAFYSIDACRLHKLFPEYEACNVAINGWFNGQMQFEIIENYIGQDDVFVHCVESCGEYQFMSRNEMGAFNTSTKTYDPRYFNCLELNYDLISLADIRHVSHFFDTFANYNNTRLLYKEPGQYTDYTLFADRRGDYSSDPTIRIKHQKDTGPISGEGRIDLNSYTSDGLTELTAYYDRLSNKGVNVGFAYACVNVESLSPEEKTYEHINKYRVGLQNGIGIKAFFINDIFDVLYPIDWFSDTDWHLDYEHALIYTDYLAEKIF